MQQPKPSTASPADRSTEFVAVEGGADTTSAGTLLVAAYLLMWTLVFGFLWLGWQRQRRTEARVGELERALARVDGEKADP
jgi:hypothetical protein